MHFQLHIQVITYQALEGQLADKELGRLLVATDLAESDGTGLVTVGLLDTTGRRGTLAGSLGSKLLTGCLATSGLASGLLGTSHCGNESVEMKCDVELMKEVSVDWWVRSCEKGRFDSVGVGEERFK